MYHEASTLIGSNAEQTRRHNRSVVLSQIRRSGTIGRAEMARSSGLSVQAVSNIIASLKHDGMLLEAGQRSHGRGLPATQFALNPEGGFALGFEIRPHSICVALINLTGELHHSEQRVLNNNEPQAVSSEMQQLVDKVINFTDIDARLIIGAGVVMPGPFAATELATTSSVLPHWQDVDVHQLLTDALSMPVLIENDANAAAVGEQISGCTANLDNFAFIYFGTGVGLGIVHQGRLFRGGSGNAGELGHILVPTFESSDFAPFTKTTRMTALEHVASRTALLQSLNAAGFTSINNTTLAQLAAADNPYLIRWLQEASAALSHAVLVVENMFDPDTIVLGGALPDAILATLVERISLADQSIAQRQNRQLPRIMQGRSGELSAAQGGAALVINTLFTPRTLS